MPVPSHLTMLTLTEDRGGDSKSTLQQCGWVIGP
uniref:Uncharacterized protein n=1 Tax=Anguilla anguilla TaxID=7936 RepID=A0A0E9SH66_ANGAN